MKVVDGHLTAAEKRAVLAIINAGLTEGRVNKKDYYIKPHGGKRYTVKIQVYDKGLIPVPGTRLRKSTYISKIEL